MLSDVWHLSDVCRVHRAISREQRSLGRLKLAQVAHVTRDSDTTFKVKCQGHQPALLTAVLARQAAAAVGVGTCWPSETATTLPSALRRRRGKKRGGGIIVAAARLQLIMPRPLGGGIKRSCASDVRRLPVWRLSVAYIGPKSRTEA